MILDRVALWIAGAALVATAGYAAILRNDLMRTREALTTAVVNAAVVEVAIGQQNAALGRQRAEDARRIDAASQALDASHALPWRTLGDAPAVGDTTCARVEEIDARFLESLQ